MCSEEIETLLEIHNYVHRWTLYVSNTKSTVDLQLNGEPALSAV